LNPDWSIDESTNLLNQFCWAWFLSCDGFSSILLLLWCEEIICNVAVRLERGFLDVVQGNKIIGEIVFLKGTLLCWEYLVSLIPYYSCMNFFVLNIL